MIPLFIEYDGCINCPICKENKSRHGYDYGGFDHELLASCMIGGCEYWGHSLLKPFITPSELRRMSLEYDLDIQMRAERIALIIENQINNKFWEE
jgi:hypothetical protein